MLQDSSMVIAPSLFSNRGCRSEADCRKCAIHMNMRGKPGTYSEDGKTLYVYGPCCCGTFYCPKCWEQMIKEDHPETKPMKYVTMEEFK